MTFSQRTIFLIIPIVGLLAFTLINFNYNRVYHGEPVSKLPVGLYNFEGLRCLVSGKEFIFSNSFDDSGIKSHELMKDLLLYDNLTGRKVLVDEQYFSPSYGSVDCKVIYPMKIRQNNLGKFIFVEFSQPNIEPENCKLEYTYRGKKYFDDHLAFSRDPQVFIETDHLVSYLLYKQDNIYLLYDERVQDLSGYGCAEQDRFVMLLSKLD